MNELPAASRLSHSSLRDFCFAAPALKTHLMMLAFKRHLNEAIKKLKGIRVSH